jgi:deferrochelatase/peroxidase EfeB
VVAGGAAGAAAGYFSRSTPPDPAAVANEAAVTGRLPAVPFHGKYQAGILPAPSRATAMVSFNATADDRASLTDLFQTLTDRARFLTAGGTPPPVGIDGPPSDSGVLGPTVVPDGLRVTFGVGSTLFDARYGLAAQRPQHLTPMKSFPNDDLDPAQCGGDLILQLSAGNADTVIHALRDIAKNTRGGMQVNWRIDGFASPARPAGTVPRNLLGFMDGIANPAVTSASQLDSLVWIEPGTAGEPAWTAGGSVLRGAADQDVRRVLGPGGHQRAGDDDRSAARHRVPARRHLDIRDPELRGRPDRRRDTADRAHAAGQPAHGRDGPSVILRRAYNYDRGIDQVGDLDMGLIFTCFQQDIKRQFEAVQTRLIGEPLVDYISPFGGGYFLALPGVTGPSDYFGRTLLA